MLPNTAASVPHTPSRQETLLQAILEAQQSMIAYCQTLRDPDDLIVDFIYLVVNKGVEELVGKPRTEIIGELMTTLFPSVKAIGLFDRYKRVVETRVADSFEFPYQADGYNGWYLISAKPLDDGFVLSFIDITAQKQAALIIERQSNQLRNIFDASISSIMYMTAIRDPKTGEIVDFLMVTANQAVTRSNFMTPDQIEGKQLLKVFPGNRDNGFFDLYVRVVESGQPEHMISAYQDDTELNGWYEISAVKQDDGVVVTYMNITETYRTQHNLERQTEFLNRLLQTSPMGIIAYESIREPGTGGKPGKVIDFKAAFFNQAYERIFDTSADVIQTQTFRQRFSIIQNDQLALNPDDLFAFYVRIVEEEVSFRREHYYPHLNKWLDVSGTRLGDGFLVILNDITDRKQAELERQQQATLVQQANRQLKRSNESLQQFAYIASHDLQEPLRKVQSFGSLLKSRYAEALGDGTHLLDRMQNAAERMQRLITDLLGYSRLSNQPASVDPVDLAQVVLDVLDDLETVIVEKSAQVNVDPLPVVWGNASQLRQLFQNLLSNALKFNQPGQSPIVWVRSKQSQREHIGQDIRWMLPSEVDTFWQLTIHDNGIGFDEMHRERIFEAFQRLHGHNSPYTGSGIGLALVKRVAENHGGAVEAHSQPGEGAVFTLYLPDSETAPVVETPTAT